MHVSYDMHACIWHQVLLVILANPVMRLTKIVFMRSIEITKVCPSLFLTILIQSLTISVA